MTDQEEKIVTGTVDNGRTVQIEVAGYTGPAASRTKGGVIELAYVGNAPRVVPAALTIDGVPHRVTAKLKSLVPGMALLHAVALRT